MYSQFMIKHSALALRVPREGRTPRKSNRQRKILLRLGFGPIHSDCPRLLGDKDQGNLRVGGTVLGCSKPSQFRRSQLA